MQLNARARVSWCAHLLKACVKQHHDDLRAPLAQLINSDSVVIDVGSHAGQFAKLFARLAPAGRVYAFEPGSYALSILRPSIWANRLRNVTIVACGLGDTATELRLSVPIKPSGSVGFGLSHIGAATPRSAAGRGRDWRFVDETIAITTLDQFVAAEGLARVDFIKADIEGWEMRMLVGAQATLAQHRPALMIEVVDAHLARAGDSAEKLFDYLAQFGYRALLWDAQDQRFNEIARPQTADIYFLSGGAGAAE